MKPSRGWDASRIKNNDPLARFELWRNYWNHTKHVNRPTYTEIVLEARWMAGKTRFLWIINDFLGFFCPLILTVFYPTRFFSVILHHFALIAFVFFSRKCLDCTCEFMKINGNEIIYPYGFYCEHGGMSKQNMPMWLENNENSSR